MSPLETAIALQIRLAVIGAPCSCRGLDSETLNRRISEAAEQALADRLTANQRRAERYAVLAEMEALSRLPEYGFAKPGFDHALTECSSWMEGRVPEKMDSKRFQDAVEFAKNAGYRVLHAGAGYYIEWRLNDRDRALLALLHRPIGNFRGIRVPVPNKIT